MYLLTIYKSVDLLSASEQLSQVKIYARYCYLPIFNIHIISQLGVLNVAIICALILVIPVAAEAAPTISPVSEIHRTIWQTQLIVGNTFFDATPMWYPEDGIILATGQGHHIQNGSMPARGSILLAQYTGGNNGIDVAQEYGAGGIILYGDAILPWNIEAVRDIPAVTVSAADGAIIQGILATGNTTITITYERSTFEALDRVRDIDTITVSSRVYGVATGRDSVQIIDMSNPAVPVSVSEIYSDMAGFDAIEGANNVKTVTIQDTPYAIILGKSSVLILDMSNPFNPVPAAAMYDDTDRYTALDGASDVEIFDAPDGIYAVVVSHDDDGIQVIDITNPYEPFPVAAAFDDMRGFENLEGARAIAAAQIQNRMYALVASYDDDALQIIDMINPRLPLPITDMNNATEPIDGAIDVEVIYDDDGTFAAVLAYNENAMRIINITTPFMPLLENTILDDRGRFNALASPWDMNLITTSGNARAVISSYDDDAIQIVDLANPSQPRPLSDTIPEEDDAEEDKILLRGAQGVSAVDIAGTTYILVAASLDDQIHVLDPTRPAAPTLTSSTLALDDIDLAMDGPGSIHVTKIRDSHYGIVANYAQDAVHIFNITIPEDPRPVSSIFDDVNGFETLDGPGDVAVISIGENTYCLVTSYNDNGVQIIDITNPENPIPVLDIRDGEDGFEALEGARGISVRENFGRVVAVVASHIDDAVQIIELSNIQFPLPAGAIYNEEEYVADEDIENDEITIRSLDGAWDVEIAIIHGKIYAVISGTNSDAVQILDITNPAYPWPVFSASDRNFGFHALRGAGDVEIVNMHDRIYALVAGKWAGAIQVIDITVPEESFAVSEIYDNANGISVLNGPNEIHATTILGRTYVVVTSILDDGIQIIDITNPGSPAAVTHVYDNSQGFSYLNGASDIDLFVTNSRLYAVVTGVLDDGISIMEIKP